MQETADLQQRLAALALPVARTVALVTVAALLILVLLPAAIAAQP